MGVCENKIRIIDSEDKIGFANEYGKILIKPQFEIATSFHKGKAIVGEKCKKIPWDEHAKEGDCHHYSIVCENQGFINENGEILKLGKYQFEDIVNEINWKPDDEEY
ncbi:WG repeat-containing protein [Kaistella sp. DKR-2]|uniref:WG repeat-containing protein n=1 Tax=Kaistella soli TaxID=2849654 RepID=UPI001C2733EC|nr:WG repeat-containing protein [Kaistella soli]MBU8882075.1 WG repeat-containing protein [Kaistella soli]